MWVFFNFVSNWSVYITVEYGSLSYNYTSVSINIDKIETGIWTIVQ